MKKLSLILLATALFAAFAPAQRGGFGAMMSGPGAENLLLRFDDVKTELKLTEDQRTKLGAVQDDARSQMMALFQNGGGGDESERAASMKKIMDTSNTAIKGILTDDQRKRLHELNIQRQGASAIADPEVQKELKLTDDQVKQVADLQKKADAANASLREKAQNGEIDRSEVGELFQKNGEVLKSALEKVLTDDQKATLKKLGGTPFTFDPSDTGFGGRRPGGGN